MVSSEMRQQGATDGRLFEGSATAAREGAPIRGPYSYISKVMLESAVRVKKVSKSRFFE